MLEADAVLDAVFELDAELEALFEAESEFEADTEFDADAELVALFEAEAELVADAVFDAAVFEADVAVFEELNELSTDDRDELVDCWSTQFWAASDSASIELYTAIHESKFDCNATGKSVVAGL